METGKAPLPPPTLCLTGIVEKSANKIQNSLFFLYLNKIFIDEITIATIKTINYELLGSQVSNKELNKKCVFRISTSFEECLYKQFGTS